MGEVTAGRDFLYHKSKYSESVLELVVITRFLRVPVRVIKIHAPRESKPINRTRCNQEIDLVTWEEVNNRGIRCESVSWNSQRSAVCRTARV